MASRNTCAVRAFMRQAKMNHGFGPPRAIRHVDRKYQTTRIEGAHGALKGIETLRAIKKGHLANNETGVLNKTAFVENLLDEQQEFKLNTGYLNIPN